MSEKPAFEIKRPDGLAYVRIYASGKVEMCPEFPDGPMIILNHIPQLLAAALYAGRKEALK